MTKGQRSPILACSKRLMGSVHIINGKYIEGISMLGNVWIDGWIESLNICVISKPVTLPQQTVIPLPHLHAQIC